MVFPWSSTNLYQETLRSSAACGSSHSSPSSRQSPVGCWNIWCLSNAFLREGETFKYLKYVKHQIEGMFEAQYIILFYPQLLLSFSEGHFCWFFMRWHLNRPWKAKLVQTSTTQCITEPLPSSQRRLAPTLGWPDGSNGRMRRYAKVRCAAVLGATHVDTGAGTCVQVTEHTWDWCMICKYMP